MIHLIGSDGTLSSQLNSVHTPYRVIALHKQTLAPNFDSGAAIKMDTEL